jgi:hypothetical protein
MAKYVVTRTDGTPVDPTEPVFVIRAKDAFALRIVDDYIDLVEGIVTPEMSDGLVKHRDKIDAWRFDNQELIKIPD